MKIYEYAGYVNDFVAKYIDMPFITLVFVSLFFLVCDLGVAVAFIFGRRLAVIEYGYSNTKKIRKQIKKDEEKQSMLSRALLFRLVVNAPKQGLFLYLELFMNFVNILAMVAALTGFFALLLFRCRWGVVLLSFSQLFCLVLSFVIESIPVFICMPIVRDQYCSRRKKNIRHKKK